MKKRIVIKTSFFPTAEEIGRILGVSKRRIKQLKKLVMGDK